MTAALAEHPADAIFQRRAGGTRRVPCFGVYDGVGTVEVRVVSDSGTPLTPWQPVTHDPTARTFMGGYDCAAGAWYRYQARYRGDPDGGATQANRWAVGVQVWVLGQSNGQNLSYGATASAALARVWQHTATEQGPAERWTPPAGVGVCALADVISAVHPGIPLGIVNAACNGSSLAQWLDATAGGPFDRFRDAFRRLGADAEFVVWVQGEEDARLGTAGDEYERGLSLVQGRLQALTGRTAAEFTVLVVQTGAVSHPEATEATKAAVRQAQDDWSHGTPGAAWGGSLLGLPTADGMHLARTPAGTGAIGAEIGRQLATRM